MSVLDKVISVNEASKELNLSSGHVKNLCALDKIKAKKIGKTWVIDKKYLETFKKNNSFE